MVGKQPVRSVASKSHGSITVMRIVLVLVSGAGGGSEVTGKSGVGSRVGAGGRVDLTFFRASLAWPFAVARLFGRCLDIRSAVRSSHVKKFPLLMAAIKVQGNRQKSARWSYISRSGFMAIENALFVR